MAIPAIDEWLHGKKEYATGLTLVHKYSKKSAFFLNMLVAGGETTFNREKLIAELIALNKLEPVKQIPVSQKITKILNDKEYAAAPVDVRALEAQAKELHKLNARRHAECGAMIKEARRQFKGDVAKQNAYLAARDAGDLVNIILDTDDDIAALFFKIDYWKDNGKLPEEEAKIKADEKSALELSTDLKNIRTRISKIKKKPERVADLNALIALRDDVERRLNGLV